MSTDSHCPHHATHLLIQGNRSKTKLPMQFPRCKSATGKVAADENLGRQNGPSFAPPASHLPHLDQSFSVTMARGNHLFPSRTQQLSPSASMVLVGRPAGRVERCRELNLTTHGIKTRGGFLILMSCLALVVRRAAFGEPNPGHDSPD